MSIAAIKYNAKMDAEIALKNAIIAEDKNVCIDILIKMKQEKDYVSREVDPTTATLLFNDTIAAIEQLVA